LNKDVPLGPNLNGAIVVRPELTSPKLNEVVPIFQISLRLLKYTQMILILSKFE